MGNSIFERKAPTTDALKLVAGSGDLSGVELVNNGAVIVYLGDADVTSATGVPLYPKCFRKFANVGSGIWGITASGTGDVGVTTITGGGTVYGGRLETTGAANNAASGYVGQSDGSDIIAAPIKILSTAITPGTTSTTEDVGTLILTTHATGRGKVFYSDGTTIQLMPVYSDGSASSTSATIATTSTSDLYMIAPFTGNLTGMDFTSIAGLTADDTDYITFSAVNLGQSGVGSTAMLAVSNANTTKATGGTGLTALAKRSLTIHGTAGNLAVTKGDVIRVRATATGTLAGAVTGAQARGYFTRKV